MTDVLDYLTTGGISTTSLFAGQMPASPDAAVCVYETGGLGPVKAMGNTAGQAKFERPRVQIVSRGARFGYADARAVAQEAFLLLDGMPSRSVNGRRYLWGSAIQSPFTMGADEQGRPLIAFNVDLVCDMSTST